MEPRPTSVIRRGGVLWRHTGEAVLVRRPGGHDVVKLAGSGVALWEALAGPVSFAQLCADLAEDHAVDLDTVRADIGPVVVDLVERGVIDIA